MPEEQEVVIAKFTGGTIYTFMIKTLKLLIISLCLFGCATNLCPDPSTAQTYDMVEWMVQSYPDHETTYLGQADIIGPISEFSYHDITSKRFYRGNAPDSNYFEEFEYDNENIYIRKEVRDRLKGDYFLHVRDFVWTKRFVRIGPNCKTVAKSSSFYFYYENCWKRDESGPDFTMEVSGLYPLSLGNDVGNVEALCLLQINENKRSHKERYCYARPWGFVYYEKIENDKVIYSENLSKKYPALDTKYTVCTGETP